MSSKNILIIMHILPLLLVHDFLVLGQQVIYPKVNCPETFRYTFDENLGGHIGLITVRKDASPSWELQVNMTLKTRMPVADNIKIVVLSKQEEVLFGEVLNYAVTFPSQANIPKLIAILFNGKVLCRDNPEPLEAGVIQTSMWAKSVVHTYGKPPDDRNKGTITPTPPVDNNPQFSLVFGSPPYLESFPFRLPNVQNNPFVPQATFDEREQATPSSAVSTPQIPSVSKLYTSSVPQTQSTIVPTTTTSRPFVETATSRAYQCGTTRSSQNLVLGGEGIAPGEFPWLAAIMYRQDTQYKLHCTGNLISDRHVLTAGHCVRYHNAPLFDNADLIIILGKLNMENWASGGTIRTAKLVESHPNYKQDHADYDIALILLSEPVTFRPTVRPICLWDRDDSLSDVIGTSGTVVGWNKDGNGELDLAAQKVEMPIVSQETCLRSNKVFMRYTSSRTFCAGARENNKGPCTGDSGAGFMIQDIVTKRWYLRGLVGFSLKDPVTLTCDLTNYVIFIDVAKIHRWIEVEMKKNQ